MSQSKRLPWDIGRFFQTLAFFDAIPLISWLKSMFFDSPSPPSQVAVLPADTIFDFQQASESVSQTWGALDDVVMGGISASSLQIIAEGAVFTGKVSTENSGGFASVRTRNFEPTLDLTSYSGIELRLRGDGQRYKFFVRDGSGWDSIGYGYSFDTVANEWITVKIPFNEMIPVFRAKIIENAPALQTQNIRSLQLMLSKFEYNGALNPHFQAGTFRLEIKTIKGYRSPSAKVGNQQEKD